MTTAVGMIWGFGFLCLIAFCGMLVGAWRDPEVRRWLVGGVRRGPPVSDERAELDATTLGTPVERDAPHCIGHRGIS